MKANALKPLALLALVAMLIAPRWSHADAPPSENQVKAAFLYNFTQFIEWPAMEPADAPFVVAIWGNDEVFDAAEHAMAGKQVGKHPILVKKVDAIDPATIQLIYLSPDHSDALKATKADLERHHVLTVGEDAAFVSNGGAVRLFLEDSHMRFSINIDIITATGLKPAAKLMKLARTHKQ